MLLFPDIDWRQVVSAKFGVNVPVAGVQLRPGNVRRLRLILSSVGGDPVFLAIGGQAAVNQGIILPQWPQPPLVLDLTNLADDIRLAITAIVPANPAMVCGQEILVQ